MALMVLYMSYNGHIIRAIYRGMLWCVIFVE